MNSAYNRNVANISEPRKYLQYIYIPQKPYSNFSPLYSKKILKWTNKTPKKLLLPLIHPKCYIFLFGQVILIISFLFLDMLTLLIYYTKVNFFTLYTY